MSDVLNSDHRHLDLRSSSSPAPISLRLKKSLQASSTSIDSEECIQSDEAVGPVTALLHSLLESDLGEALPALDEIYRYVSSPDSNGKVVEALSLELPQLVVRFAALSAECWEIAGRIIDYFASVCNPREMLSVLCEALSSHSDNSEAPGCYSHILFGLSKVLLRIQRRHIEQVKVVLPVIVDYLHVASSGAAEEDKDYLNDLLSAAISIGSSIQEICQKLEGQSKEVLCAILGLYVLQNIALISGSRQKSIVETSSLIVAKFSRFLPFCGLSYFGLLTGDLDKLIEISKDGDDDKFVASFSSAICGASLTVIWCHISDEVVKATGKQLDDVLSKLREDRFRRWQAIGMFKHTFSSIDYPWNIKSHGIDVLLSIFDGIIYEEEDIGDDFSSFLPDLFSSLMAIERIMIGAPDPSLRKRAFIALRKVLSDIPCSQRFDTLKALISNTDSPSMVAILIDIVKDYVLVDGHKENLREEQSRKEISTFWGSHALEIVEMVLRPPKGGPPSLPEDSEPVLSALNLYRFIIIIELTGKTNYTGILSEDSLQKAYSEWIMPLRSLVSGILAENENDDSELAEGITCSLSPVQLVLHRCIELIEESLKQS